MLQARTYRLCIPIGYFCKILAVLLLCDVMPVRNADAQTLNLKFSHINIGQGLSNSTVEAIYQDSRGFIWLGTRDGLDKYDGDRFTVFKNDPGDPRSISDNYITCMQEDAQHRLWIGTTDGLDRFDADKRTFTRYRHNLSQRESITGNAINCIYTTKNGELWIGTNTGLSKYNPAKNNFISYGDADMEVNDLLEDSRHQLLLATGKGVRLLDPVRRMITTVPGLAYPAIKIKQDLQGNYWLGTLSDGLVMFNVSKHLFKQFEHNDKDPGSISTSLVRSLLLDHKGQVWVGGLNGSLDLLKKDGRSFLHAQNEPGNPLSLSQKTVSALFEDNEDNLWVGTHRGGLNFYAPLSDKFQLLQQGTSENSLSYNDVKSFFQDSKGHIWIGTDDEGLNLYDETTNDFTHYRYNPYDSRSISSDAVLNITEDRYRQLWIGTWGGGLDLMNRNSHTFTRLVNKPSDATTISSNYIQTTLQDSEGNFWVATYYGGLDLFDPRTHVFKRVYGDARQQTSLYGNNIIALNEDKDKNLWIGTDDGGLNCYNLIKKTFTHYFVSGDKTPDIRVIFTDNKGRVWVGQSGLYLFNRAENKFEKMAAKDGLATEFIKGILEDEDGNLWISTSNGLYKFNPDTHALKKYNAADGLQGLEFEAGAAMKTKSGEFYFGGINGFNRFFPNAIKRNPFVPPVYITGLQLFGREILPGQQGSPLQNDISLTHDIRLNYEQSALTFDFAGLNYAAPENNRYAYKLAGFDRDWQYTAERKANYTNLDPGNYTFYVKASNNDDLWNPKSAYVHIYIAPPFWAAWWFRLIVISSIVTIAYLLLRFKKNFDLQRLEENKREEMHTMQLQFFTNISHEFRTPLSLILGPLEKMIREDSRPFFHVYYQTMQRNANRLLLLINELMDFRKAETGALRLKVMPGNLDLFITEIVEDFRDLAAQKQISLQLLTEMEAAETWFDRQIMEKILINLIHNACKYTPDGGQVTVGLYSDPGRFQTTHRHHTAVEHLFRAKKYAYIRVSDNGIGISKDSIHHLFERYYRITDTHMGSGVGLAFVKSLSLLHKGSITVYSERNTGTDFILRIPVGKADYADNEQWISYAADSGVQLESINGALFQTDAAGTEPVMPQAGGKIVPQPTHKILIVDDNEELRNLLHHSLDEFYEVIEAADGAAGWKKAKEELPDMIISDLMMPVMNGIDFCMRIKSDTETSQIPFIILSAKDALESKIAGAASGADLYFPKPVSINLLLLSINNIFEKQATLKERSVKEYFFEARESGETQQDAHFIDQLSHIVETQLNNAELDVDYVCREMGMSKTKLYLKIKKVSGLSIGEFVRTYRLKKAAYIIAHEDVLLTEVMYRVGIQTQSYFTKAFKKEFGKTPSQFVNELRTGKSK